MSFTSVHSQGSREPAVGGAAPLLHTGSGDVVYDLLADHRHDELLSRHGSGPLPAATTSMILLHYCLCRSEATPLLKSMPYQFLESLLMSNTAALKAALRVMI